MTAEGNVVIYSPTTDLMLLGNKVLWDNRAKRILSEDNVTIVKITDNDKSPCIQKSVGFESDMDLSNYILDCCSFISKVINLVQGHRFISIYI